MIDLTVDVDDQSGIAGMISGLRQQMPFALSLGLNNTANVAQKAVQAKLPAEFDLRAADFITNTIYRKPGQDFATKTNLAATIRVNPARNQLAKFEIGGEKESISGKSLAVPVFREDSPNIIIRRGDPLSVAKLFDAIQKRSGKQFKPRRRKGEPKPAPIDQGRVFLVKNAKGTFILERQHPGRDGNRVLYWFRKSVPIPASLHFDETALQAALAAWEIEFPKAIDYAMATAK